MAATYNIRKSMIETKLEKVMEAMNLDRGKAFERLVYSWIFGSAPHEVPKEDNVDGGQDKQIDYIVIDDRPTESRAMIHIMQVKAADSFSSNALVQLHNGLHWVWSATKVEYSSLSNVALKLKIQEIRELLNDYGPSNLDVRVYFVTTGDYEAVRDDSEFKQEQGRIEQAFATEFRSFAFVPLGASELIDVLNRREQTGRSIDANIKMVYDVNKPSLIKFSSHGLNGAIFSVTGEELGNLVKVAPNQSIFDKNIRPYLGDNEVNQEIYKTCSSIDDAHFFWFLNNGVTMVCDSFDAVQDPDNPHIKAKNLQIVNGCQTSTTLAKALEHGVLHSATNVLVKIFATTDVDFVERITFSTNSQTAIGARDLKANEQIQKDLQRLFGEKYGVQYERKVNEFSHLLSDPKKRVVSNERVGQAFLAVGLKKPTVARTQKYKVFKPEFYDDIFVKSTPATLYYSWSVHHFASLFCEQYLSTEDLEEEEWAALTYGGFHIARILGALLVGSDSQWPSNKLEAIAKDLLESPQAYRLAFDEAYRILVHILKDRPIDSAVTNYFKTQSIQGRINGALTGMLR